MVYVGPGYSVIRPGWITPLFVGLDVLAIATQGIGSALIFGTDLDVNKLSRGRSILIGGLFIQLAAFAVFLSLALYFDRKTTVALRQLVAPLRPLMNAFYLSGAMIFLRSIYRAVGEYKTIWGIIKTNVLKNSLRWTFSKGRSIAIFIILNGHTMSSTHCQSRFVFCPLSLPTSNTLL